MSREPSLTPTFTSITNEVARDSPPLTQALPSTPVRPVLRQPPNPTVTFMPQHSSTLLNPGSVRRTGNQTMQEYTANFPSLLNVINAPTLTVTNNEYDNDRTVITSRPTID